MGYEQVFIQMKNFGFFDVFLPFMLIFSFSFVIANQLPHVNRRQAGIFALVIGLVSIASHVMNFGGAGFDVIDFINSIIPGITALVIAIIGFFLILALVAPEFVKKLGDPESNKNPPALLIIIPLIILAYIFIKEGGWIDENSSISLGIVGSWLENPENAALVAMLLTFVIIIWFVTHPSEKKAKKNDDALKKFLTDLFIGRQK